MFAGTIHMDEDGVFTELDAIYTDRDTDTVEKGGHLDPTSKETYE